MEIIAGIIAIIAGTVMIWGLFSLLWIMAEERGQPPLLWVLLFFIIGPFAHLALWVFYDIQDGNQSSGRGSTE